MHIFFSVGEPSGDLHGSKLVRELQNRVPGVECSGFGGPLMQDAGCDLIFRLTDLAVMGFLRVVPLLWTFFRLYRTAKQFLREHRPDAVVLIDFPGFNWWIARAARRHGIPVFYYVPPQLWAWAPWRVRKMRRFVDHVLCCLPFEREWYESRGVSAELVGHPFFDEVAERRLDQPFLNEQRGKTPPGTKIVAILPGSRNHEILHNFADQLHVMSELHRLIPAVRFLIASYKESQKRHCERQLVESGLRLPVEFHVGKTSEIVELADVCLMVSGSVSLELLARSTPAVVIYRVSHSLYWFGRALITCRFISLPNLMVGRTIMPEFAPRGRSTAELPRVTEILHQWLTDEDARRTVIGELTAVRDRYATAGATAGAAMAILNRLAAASSPPAGRRAAA